MELDELRSEIKETDKQIMALMRHRLELAEDIGRLKQGEGAQIRNKSVESAVIARYRDFATDNGMDPDAAETVCRTLIQESVERQASLPRINQHPLNVAIVGGRGKMGQWLAKILTDSGNKVVSIDAAEEDGPTLMDTRRSDVVIVSVPISQTGIVLGQLDGICRNDALIFDIASLKTPFVEMLKDMAARRKVCSVHPMFGPSAKSMYSRNLLFCDCGNMQAVTDAKALFGDRGADERIIPIEDHDKYMSYVLGLSHAVNIAFFTVLERSGIDYDDMKTVASTTFRKNMDTNRSVASEDPMLYYGIQHLNASRDAMWAAFSQAVEDLQKASKDDNPGSFVTLMNKGREYFGDDKNGQR
jgi:chorismate mutase/prephenate dehydrogenase